MTVKTSQGGRPHLVRATQLPFRHSALDEFAQRRRLKPLRPVSDGPDCIIVAAASSLSGQAQRLAQAVQVFQVSGPLGARHVQPTYRVMMVQSQVMG